MSVKNVEQAITLLHESYQIAQNKNQNIEVQNEQ